jgi:cysteine desulfuration protein SufE
MLVLRQKTGRDDMTLADKQQALTETLVRLPGVAERLGWLVEQARQRPLLPAEHRVDANRVEGCLARLWFVSEFRRGRCYFYSDSDSLIVKSIAGLLCDFYTGQRPEEIVVHDPAFLSELGITQHITPNRRNALSSVWKKIFTFAEAHLSSAAAPTMPAGINS